MAKTALYNLTDGGLQASLASLFRSMLEQGLVSAVMAPMRLSPGGGVMQTLVTDPAQMDMIDLFAPSFPLNAARLVSRLSKKPTGGTVAVVLRPCEIRAHVELVKLKQGSIDDLIVVGIDCPGAFNNADYGKIAADERAGFTDTFLSAVLSGETSFENGLQLSTACRACVHPVPHGADVSIGIFGIDIDKQFLLGAETEKGEGILDALGLSVTEAPDKRDAVIESLIAKRETFRNEMFEATHEKTDTPEKLANYLSGCINCYNCRVACPVCYCRECVFVTDVFDHDPYQYLRWARRKGKIRMPTDTVFYHITRMAHISTACVACGQCSNACPNDISLMELFSMTAHATQVAFDYEAGRSLTDDPPLSVFKENELADVVEVKH